MAKETDDSINRFVELFEQITKQKLTNLNKDNLFEYDPDEDELLKEFYAITGVTFSKRGHYDLNEKALLELKNYLNMTGVIVVDTVVNK
jgi:hypothetical protein